MCEYGGGLPSPATVTGAGTQELFAAARRALYEASRKSAPVRVGFYEGDRVPAIEVHLKQAGIDKTGWGFFGFGDSAATATMIPGAAPCYSCHATEAAHDQVFTQFYPPLLSPSSFACLPCDRGHPRRVTAKGGADVVTGRSVACSLLRPCMEHPCTFRSCVPVIKIGRAHV